MSPTPPQPQPRTVNDAATRWRLLWPLLAFIALPLATAWFVYPEHLPPGFGVFPPVLVQPEPKFWLPYFLLMSAVGLVVVVFLLFPQWFGFRPAGAPAPQPVRAALPPWFWIGTVLTPFFWWLMWARVTVFGSLVYYAFTPLWWGFILLLDGLVYRRLGGRSLLATRPRTLAISALVSVPGWFLFEYLDYFALGNWYYPNGDMAALSHATIVLLFLVAYSTVWPAIFEWYTLLASFPRLVGRYADGPKLALPGGWMLLLGLASIVAMTILPVPLFWVLWIGLTVVLGGQMLRLKVWTPLSSMSQGNWAPMVLVCLASLANGFFWELWNYGSAHPNPLPPTNPNYWIYDVPYVNVIHLWSEMPLLGYLGYLPFGLLVWLVFLWAGRVFGFDAGLELARQAQPAPQQGASAQVSTAP